MHISYHISLFNDQNKKAQQEQVKKTQLPCFQLARIIVSQNTLHQSTQSAFYLKLMQISVDGLYLINEVRIDK